MDFTFISRLRVPEMTSGVSGSNSRRRTQYAFSLTVAIERHCSIDANHAQRDALARPERPEGGFLLNNFELFRARLDKRAALAFHKANRRPDVRNAPGHGRVSMKNGCERAATIALPGEYQ
jgi:hypothetical protein